MKSKSRSLTYFFLVVFLIALLLRVGVAMRVPSLVHVDEVFQTQEPAHRLAYGYGVVTWEWREGVRSWVFPAFLAGVMRATDWMGPGSSGYLWGIDIVLSLISLTTVWFGFAWARRASGIEAAMIAAGACAIWYELVIFAPRTLNEVLAAHILLPGLYLGAYSDGPREKRKLFVAGILCGLAMSLRIQLAPAAVCALLYFCRSNWRAKMPAVLAGALLPVAAFGLVDAITWSYPFQSFFRYFWVDTAGGRSAFYGTQPWYWYLSRLLARLGGPLLVLAALGVRRSPFLGWIALAVLLPHSVILHKEDRYIYPLMPLLITLAALGCMEIARKLDGFWKSAISPKAVVVTALVFFALCSAFLAPRFNYWERHSGGMIASDQLSDDWSVCGLGLYGVAWYSIGGYTHLHRDVPMVLIPRGAGFEPSSFNVLITSRGPADLPGGFELKECWHGVCVYRRIGSCTNPQRNEVNAELRRTGN
jgi:GPI mannosyltransferase 3